MSPLIDPLPIQDLERLLSQTLGTNFQIKSVDWKPLTDPGENFGSVILAINVTILKSGTTETLNLVAKLPPKSAYLLDLFDSPVTFKKELYFYSRIAKDFRALQLEQGIKEESLLAPKFLGGRLGLQEPEVFDEQATIVLENLRSNGYDTQDRIDGLDKKHTEFALKELARLHSLAIALKFKKPEYFEKNILQLLKQKFNANAEKCVIEMIRKGQSDIKELPETKPYWDRIDRTVECGIKSIQGRIPEEPWGTMIHNDFWVNNMMFRHGDSGNVTDLRMVDFQLCVYDYGMCDLIFFLISSAQPEVLDNHLDYMLDLYYNTFIESLKSLEIDISLFSKEKFDELVKFCAPMKFNQCIMMVHVIKSSRKTAHELKNVEGADMFLKRGGDMCNSKLSHIVRLFAERDWLLK